MIPQLATVAALLVGSSLAVPSNVEKLRRVDTPVENSYIVVLKDSVDRGAKLQALDKLVVTSKHVKQVVYSDWKVLNGYSAQLSGAALEHVLADPDVDYVEENGAFTINWTAEPVPAREPAPEADPAPRRDTVHQLYRRAGEGVDIYGIDTGIFVNHTSFGGRARWGAVFGGYKQQDGNGHGTHTAGTFGGEGFGPATGADIIAVKVLSDSGSGTNADVIAGINFATTSATASGKPSVANLSLGGSVSNATDTAVRNGILAGVHFTLAAGNSNANAQTFSPARVTEAVTVGSLTATKAKSSFSNFGAVLDVWFLGSSVTSAWIGSVNATNTISGTSMAAPGVAGILATAISTYGNKTVAELQEDLKAHAISDATGIPSGTTKRRAVAW